MKIHYKFPFGIGYYNICMLTLDLQKEMPSAWKIQLRRLGENLIDEITEELTTSESVVN